MSDRLSAASLLLAIVAVLYGMWYPQLTQALETKVPEFPAERPGLRKQVLEVRRTRALPLMLAAIGLALVFLPDVVGIAARSIGILIENGVEAVRLYDSVTTAFLLVEVVSLYFAIHFTAAWIELTRLISGLSRAT